MFSSEHQHLPQRQVLPSLSQILSQDQPANYSNHPSLVQQSPPLAQPRNFGSHDDTPAPASRGPSPYYLSYQLPPPVVHFADRRVNENQNYQSPPTGPHQSVSGNNDQYTLSSGSPLESHSIGQQGPSLSESQLRRSSAVKASDSRQPLSLPHQTPTAVYMSPQRSSTGPSPRAPRVVDERFVTGEGICYVYEDGTRVQKYIDGEGVNPQWGVTKAGKPRKRLAQACTTCREKKIRCDPSSPKCHQCQKFNRDCKFESAPRGHHHLSSNFTPNMARPGAQQAGYGGPTSTTASDSVTSHAPMKRPPEGEYQVSLINGQPMTEAEIDAKKQRRGSASSSDDESSPRKSKLLKGNLATPSSSTDGPTIAAEVDGPLGIDWKVDPWELDAESSNYHTDLYFDNINSATYCMFPRDPFMRWCQECRTKDEKDKMLVYSLLAMGSIFSTRPGRHSTVRKLLGVAEYAVTSSFGKFSLQLVQARLILALVHFSLGNSMKAWDYCGAGIRSACGMKLNVEEGIQNMTTEENLDYWFNASTLRECHRRTFWSAFIMDRFNGFCSGHISILHIDDCLIRLPALESCYDSQVECSPTPFFRNNLIDPTLCAPAQSPSTIGSMGHLVTISSLWGEVLAFLYRSAYISSSLYSQHYDVHYSALMNRLSEWHSSLPPHLVWSPSNLDSTLRTGYIGTYVTMHTMYHASVIKLNRHTNFSHLSLEEIQRNTRIAHHHARALLTATRLMTQIDQTAHLHYSDTQFAFSTPSIGYSILAAVDVLSYAGSLDDLAEVIQLIDSGLEITEELVGFWSSAKSQFRLIGSRLQALTEIHADLGSNGPPLESEMHRDNANVTTITRHSSAKAWALSDPLDNIFTAVEDVIYHFDKVKYLKFIGVDVQAPEDVV